MKNVVLDVKKEYSADVVVCGGGVSGFSAAVSAARNGAKTILIESGGFLGGTATKGLVGPFMTCYDAKGKEQIIKGLFSELVEELDKEGGCIHHTKCPGEDSYSGYRMTGHIGVTPFNHETLKRVMERMCLEAGVKLLYHTVVIGCEKEGDTLKTVYAADSNDIISIEGKMFIDATGSAVLANKAGAETMRGNDDGIVQTASTFYIVSGVNKKVLDDYMAEHKEMRSRFYMDLIEEKRAEGKFPCGTYKLRLFEAPDDLWVVNMAQVDEQFNELDGEELTNAEISQRKQIVAITEFLKENIPGLENIRMVTSASDIGIRESRRIVGKHIFCLEDIQNTVKFDDRIAVCANSIDVHEKDCVKYITHSDENYYIPLSCLISNNVDNLFAAGKCLSADRYAFAAVRVMPPCIAMGQAAGTAAAVCVKENVKTSDVPVTTVQEILVKNGAYIG